MTAVDSVPKLVYIVLMDNTKNALTEKVTLVDGTLTEFRVHPIEGSTALIIFTGFTGAVYPIQKLIELAEAGRSLALELGADKILSPEALTDVVTLAHQLLEEI